MITWIPPGATATAEAPPVATPPGPPTEIRPLITRLRRVPSKDRHRARQPHTGLVRAGALTMRAGGTRLGDPDVPSGVDGQPARVVQMGDDGVRPAER